MARRLWMGIAVLLGLILNGAPDALSKSKPDNDYPDYNRLEYAKPLPAPDQQIQPPPPGSISMRVGEKKTRIDAVPPDTLSIPIRSRDDDSGSEPPIADLLDDYKIAPATPPALAVTTSTAPATAPGTKVQ